MRLLVLQVHLFILPLLVKPFGKFAIYQVAAMSGDLPIGMVVPLMNQLPLINLRCLEFLVGEEIPLKVYV